MQHTENQKQQIIDDFVRLCKKINYTPDDKPLLVHIKNGLPVCIEPFHQSIKLDIPLTKDKGYATMD